MKYFNISQNRPQKGLPPPEELRGEPSPFPVVCVVCRICRNWSIRGVRGVWGVWGPSEIWGTRKLLPGNLLPGNLLPGNLLPGNLLPGNLLPGKLMSRKLLPGKWVSGKWVPGKWVSRESSPRKQLSKRQRFGSLLPGGYTIALNFGGLNINTALTTAVATALATTLATTLTTALTTALTTVLSISPGFAQGIEQLPACQPPNPDEYLLLVVTPTPETQEQLKQALPPTVNVPACNYLGSRVSRMGGFQDLENANAWSQYITEVVGLPAFVARPSSNPTTSFPPGNLPASTAAAPPFQPKALGRGYAVLVDFFSNPTIASQLQQARQQTPGLAAYGQRPYLLAYYSSDSSAAVAILSALADRGFQVLLVDSREVTVLTERVQL